jgi:serpin B
MAAAGAKGETLAQMERALCVKSFSSAHRAFAELVASFPSNVEPDDEEAPVAPAPEAADPDMPEPFRPPSHPMLALADRAFAQRDFTYRSDFLSVLSDVYRAPLQLVDFKRDSEDARQTINTWTEKQTRGRITDLLPEKSIDDLTRLILVNALYFKAAWLQPFEPGRTRDEDFAAPDRSIRAKMMRQLATLPYHHEDGVALVELAYRESSITLVVLLPDDPSDLPDLERSVGRDYGRWVAALSSARVDLWLPRWKQTMYSSMSATLRRLGMELPFACRADFSGMTDELTDDPCPLPGAASGRRVVLHIDEVVQKTFVDVNEHGTEAAAATAIVMATTTSARVQREQEPIVFHADHPFLYLIRDRRTGVILFVGRVTRPG